ncbi:MAG: hypothetical protein IPO06_15750 [Leptospiraceae bacterium]|nr:hypothetical protein [Leptospiraceae bacterium]
MDKKDRFILALVLVIVAMLAFIVYNTKKQQEVQQQLLRTMEYNSANPGCRSFPPLSFHLHRQECKPILPINTILKR